MRTIHLTITHTRGSRRGGGNFRIMIYVLTPEEMRAADAAAIDRVGAIELMSNAGRRHRGAPARIATARRTDRAFAGPGNNGGDAFSCARRACERIRLYGRRRSFGVWIGGPKRRAGARGRSSARIVALPPGERERSSVAAPCDRPRRNVRGTGARLPLPERTAISPASSTHGNARFSRSTSPAAIDALTGRVAEDAVRATRDGDAGGG